MGNVDVTRIDRQAWAWHAKLIEMRCGLPRDRAIEALPLHGLHAPLPHDRLDLVYRATSRSDPSREAFVTLALVDFIEDLETLPIGERTAKLPYQLAWARAGFTLVERTGLPGGIIRARWPDVDVGAMSAAPAPPGDAAIRRQPGQPGERNGLLSPVRLGGNPDLLRGQTAEARELRRAADRPKPTHEQLRIDGVSAVPSALDN